jgi:ribosomal protein S18 acetylase RimI-like enzyme
MIDISLMTEADIPFAVEMTTIEGWGHSAADFERLLFLAPEGCFVAGSGGRRLGMITTTRHGDFAFLACLIVREEARRQGIGRQLLRRAISYLESVGVTSMELDGVFKAAPLYRRVGFKDKYLSLRLHGKSALREKPATECRP